MVAFETLVSWVGIDHMGLGSDFFGMDMTPAGYTAIDQLPNVTRALIERGFTATTRASKSPRRQLVRVFRWH